MKTIRITTGEEFQIDDWYVQLRYGKKRVCSGSFDSEIKAAEFYNFLAAKLQGEYAFLNQLP